MSKTLLLDADSFCYSFGLSYQMPIPWTPELWTYKADLSGAKAAFEDSIDRAMKATECTHIRVALSDARANFRKRIAPYYKASRIYKEKPILFRALREWLQEKWDAHISPALEGDDLVSMWATSPKMGETVVCSIDKDCKTIPGWLYNPAKQTLEHYSRWMAEAFFLSQVLTGDKVDGYSGCPGIGPKRCEQILEPPSPFTPAARALEDMWDRIVAAYEKAGLTEAVALENARCARLLRYGEYQGNRVKLWHPRGEDEWLDLQ